MGSSIQCCPLTHLSGIEPRFTASTPAIITAGSMRLTGSELEPLDRVPARANNSFRSAPVAETTGGRAQVNMPVRTHPHATPTNGR
ncbi:MAG: hypothetical protein IPG69_21315 [Flavobacteriales bacterium]|nr:hypothetical protein [Flavobacteriales bacterium]